MLLCFIDIKHIMTRSNHLLCICDSLNETEYQNELFLAIMVFNILVRDVEKVNKVNLLNDPLKAFIKHTLIRTMSSF